MSFSIRREANKYPGEIDDILYLKTCGDIGFSVLPILPSPESSILFNLDSIKCESGLGMSHKLIIYDTLQYTVQMTLIDMKIGAVKY